MNNFAKVYSAELDGINARIIEVEADIASGLHSFNIVGLADKALSEAKERVNSALKNSGTKPPNKENRRIIVNLAPADIKKNGSQYDLSVAVGYLLATKQIKPFTADDKIFIGELALNGEVRGVNGALNIAETARRAGYQYLILPAENAEEAAHISNIRIVPVKNLTETIQFLEGVYDPAPVVPSVATAALINVINFSKIKGQGNAKRALTIAAAGGHNLLMVGPPGAGKSLMAESLISILPDLESGEAVEITKIYSAAGLNKGGLANTRPFRAPHHSASAVAVIGGGTNPRPGEISLAHRGVLFMDELPEFPRNILEALRQPLESGSVCVSRAKNTLTFPAKFTLVAAMNPCPCGYFGDKEKTCNCTAYEVFKYQKKISGPLLDRMDIQINVPRSTVEELMRKTEPIANESDLLRNKINTARTRAKERFTKLGKPIFANAEMTSEDCDNIIHLDKKSEEFVKQAIENNFVSARGYYRILKTARTIADLEESEGVTKDHLAEAFGYRVRQKE